MLKENWVVQSTNTRGLYIPWCTSAACAGKSYREVFPNAQSVRTACQEGPSEGRLQDLPDPLPAYWSESSSERGKGTGALGSCSKISSKCTTCRAAGGERQQRGLEVWMQTVLYSECNYKRQWNFSGDGSAAHTDYRDWHSKFLYLWQMTTMRKALHLLTVLFSVGMFPLFGWDVGSMNWNSTTQVLSLSWRCCTLLSS